MLHDGKGGLEPGDSGATDAMYFQTSARFLIENAMNLPVHHSHGTSDLCFGHTPTLSELAARFPGLNCPLPQLTDEGSSPFARFDRGADALRSRCSSGESKHIPTPWGCGMAVPGLRQLSPAPRGGRRAFAGSRTRPAQACRSPHAGRGSARRLRQQVRGKCLRKLFSSPLSAILVLPEHVHMIAGTHRLDPVRT